jgi:hypothetical protein
MSKLAWGVFYSAVALLFIFLLGMFLSPFLANFTSLKNGLLGI